MADEVKNTTAETSGEGLAQQLMNELSGMKAELAKAQAAITKAERRRDIERALAQQQVKDVIAAADMLDASDGDPQALARELRRTKPGLFKSGLAGMTTTTVPAAQAGGNPQLVVLRERARQGDRASLLLYLRARRQKD